MQISNDIFDLQDEWNNRLSKALRNVLRKLHGLFVMNDEYNV